MNLHLAEISRHVTPGSHAVVLLDGAGWHQTGECAAVHLQGLFTAAIFAAKIDVAERSAGATNATMIPEGGYQENGKLERLLRDAQAAHISLPSNR